MSEGETRERDARMKIKPSRWRAKRGVSWTLDQGVTWVDRGAGDDVSDAPEKALREWSRLEEPAVEEVAGG